MPTDRRTVAFDRAIATHGARFAVALLGGHDGDPDHYTGWTGFLQMAVDYSSEDPEMLDLADRVHRTAGGLRHPDALWRFAQERREGPGGAAAQGFLRGVLRGVRAVRLHGEVSAP